MGKNDLQKPCTLHCCWWQKTQTDVPWNYMCRLDVVHKTRAIKEIWSCRGATKWIEEIGENENLPLLDDNDDNVCMCTVRVRVLMFCLCHSVQVKKFNLFCYPCYHQQKGSYCSAAPLYVCMHAHPPEQRWAKEKQSICIRISIIFFSKQRYCLCKLILHCVLVDCVRVCVSVCMCTRLPPLCTFVFWISTIVNAQLVQCQLFHFFCSRFGKDIYCFANKRPRNTRVFYSANSVS